MTIEDVGLLFAGLVGGAVVKVFFDLLKDRTSDSIRKLDELTTKSAVHDVQVDALSHSGGAKTGGSQFGLIQSSLTFLTQALSQVQTELSALRVDIAALRSEKAELLGRFDSTSKATEHRLDGIERRLEKLEESELISLRDSERNRRGGGRQW